MVQDIDLIILGGYYGDGKFIGLIKSFLMGVASSSKTSDENPKEFSSVVSVSNGLSMDTLKELDKMFKDKWQKDRPENVVPPRVSYKNKYLCSNILILFLNISYRLILQIYGFALKILLF